MRQEQINDVHRAVVRGRLREVQTLISHKSLSLARDAMGLTPLHKAALFGHYDVAEHLAVNFPASMAAKDLDGRTALHLAAGLRDGQKIYDMLIFAGAPTSYVDTVGRSRTDVEVDVEEEEACQVTCWSSGPRPYFAFISVDVEGLPSWRKIATQSII